MVDSAIVEARLKMTTSNNSNNNYAAIINRLKKTGRIFFALETLTFLLQLLCYLCVFFWTSFLFDRFFITPRSIRFIFLVFASGGIVYFLLYFMRILLFHQPSLEDISLFYEHRFPTLKGTLSTTVSCKDLTEQPAGRTTKRDRLIYQEFWNRTCQQAAEQLQLTSPARLFRVGRLLALWGVTVVFVAFTFSFILYHPNDTTLWVSRNICLSQRRPEPLAKLFLSGFDQERSAQCIAGTPFTLKIFADLNARRIPDSVFLSLVFDNGRKYESTISTFQTESGNLNTGPGKYPDQYRVFTALIPSLDSSCTLTVSGADALLDGYRIHAVPRPQIDEWSITRHFPKYLDLKDETSKEKGSIIIPEGTSLTIRQTASPTVKAIYCIAETEQTETGYRSCLQSEGHFLLSVGPILRNTILTFTAEDNNKISSLPVALEIVVQPDLLPEVTAEISGIGKMITPRAVLPIKGKAVDDHGLNDICVQWQINSQPAESITLIPFSRPEKVHHFFTMFEIAPFLLQAGDQLTLSFFARDRATGIQRLKEKEGPSRTFDVVSPQTLAEELQKRETAFRTRLENVLREMSLTDQLLQQWKENPLQNSSLPERILRDSGKERFDLARIAEGIQLVCDEVVHNALPQTETKSAVVYTAGYEKQLRSFVVAPLEEIATHKIPLFEKEMKERQNKLSDEEVTRLVDQFKKILSATTEAFANMKALNTFQSLRENFRAIETDLETSRQNLMKKRFDALRDLQE